jgi:GWxTD domain-containing protein
MAKQLLRFSLLVFTILLLVFGFSCKSPARLAFRNIAPFYNPDSEFKGLSYELFNLDDSITNLYLSFPYKQLLYVKENGSQVANFRFFYQLYDGFDNSRLIDSASFYGSDSLKKQEKFLDSIPLVTFRGRNYIINAELTDLNSGKSYGRFLSLNKSKLSTNDDVILLGSDNLPLMRNYVHRNESFQLRLNEDLKDIKIALSSGASLPAINPYAASARANETGFDSTFTVGVYEGFSDQLLLNNPGTYFIVSENEDVFLAHRFYDGFPEIGTVAEMRESLRYISTDSEYRNMMAQPPRAAVDDFWIKITGHPERALQQIKRYYKRVEEANRFFTLSKEGWKSDRGMIYIVYGPPSVVYRNAFSEEWTYGEIGNPLSVRFLFNSVSFAGDLTEFELVRSDNYRNSWHLAVSNWRR